MAEYKPICGLPCPLFLRDPGDPWWDKCGAVGEDVHAGNPCCCPEGRLQAGAPKLLAALEAVLVAYMNELRGRCYGAGMPSVVVDRCVDEDEDVQQARAALAAVKGE